MEAVLNTLKHAVNPAQEGTDPDYKKCYLHVIISYTSWWHKVNLIAMRLSKANKIKQRDEAIINTAIKVQWTFSSMTLLLRSNNRNSLHSMYDGWSRKQASKRLLLVEGCGLLFTAIIISTLIRAVKGQLTV